MTGPGWPDARGWLVIITAGLLVMVLAMIYSKPDLAESQLFVAMASGVIGASFLSVVGMWTNATKSGSDLAQKAMDKVTPPPTTPAPVVVTNDDAQPVPTTEAK